MIRKATLFNIHVAITSITIGFSACVGAKQIEVEQVRKIRPKILNGTAVSVENQRRLGLVRVGGGCSGNLLNKFWVQTADHCVRARSILDTAGCVSATLPLTSLTITAEWSTKSIVPTRVVRYCQSNSVDYALIFLGGDTFENVPFQKLAIAPPAQNSMVTSYGTGLSSYAVVGPPPRQGTFGPYLSGRFTVSSSNNNTTYSFLPNANGQIIGGGDSGGPDVNAANEIVGVHSFCNGVTYVPSKPEQWQWTTSIGSCSSASNFTIRNSIIETIREQTFGWSDWTRLGGTLGSDISCTTWSEGRIDCFALEGANQVLHVAWNGVGWSNDKFNSDTALSSQPECVSWEKNRIDCFARGIDGRIHTISWNGERWVGWGVIGGSISSDIKCTTWAAGRIDCVALRGPKLLVHVAFDGKNWDEDSFASDIDLVGRPECVSWSRNRIDCFVRSIDNRIRTISWTGSDWVRWGLIGSTVSSDIKCTTWAPGRIDCFALRGANVMVHDAFDGKRWSEDSFSGDFDPLGRPECVSWGLNRIDCFARASDKSLYTIAWTGKAWEGWASLGGILVSNITCTSWGPGRIDCFARGTDNSMFQKAFPR